MKLKEKYQGCLCGNCLKELSEKNKSKLPGTILLFCLTVSCSFLLAQPYAPPVGQMGTTAMHKDSAAFVNWALSCVVNRGLQDISNSSSGFATVGDGSMACGKAQSNAVVSLGDGGTAICTFPFPISNQSGYDFAIFENSIDDTFLELALVEVSSDGQNFFRFPSHSLTDTTTQTGGFDPTSATKINNLAGKYRAGYGTPFDLQDLANTQGLNINAVTHVKIIDVVGSINNQYATRDAFQNKINDPWPTAFPSGGFDLDAVGVIHQNTVTGLETLKDNLRVEIFPNPVKVDGTITIVSEQRINNVTIIDLQGKEVYQTNSEILNPQLQPGLYFLRILADEKIYYQKITVI